MLCSGLRGRINHTGPVQRAAVSGGIASGMLFVRGSCGR